MPPDVEGIVASVGGVFEPALVMGAVQDWIDCRLLGEPQLLTDTREAYVAHHLERSLAAIALVPRRRDRGRMLELGSGIYLMTFLVEKLCNYDVELVQYWGRPSGQYASVLVSSRTGERRVMPFHEFNAENERFPYPNASFDVILNCDMIEHLLCNPVHMLAECHRVLKPGGVMVLTTPNVLRLDNVVRLLQGANIHDKYVKQSASARHPREYAPAELRQLLDWVGFDVLQFDTRDVSARTVPRSGRRLARAALRLFDVARRFTGSQPGALGERGEQMVLLARRRGGAARRDAPDFLYEAPGAADALIAAIYGEAGATR